MKVVFRVTVACAGLLLALPGGVRAQLTDEQKAKLPPAADHKVSFAKEIYPLLEQSCTKCHGKGKAKGKGKTASAADLDLDTGLDLEETEEEKARRIRQAVRERKQLEMYEK